MTSVTVDQPGTSSRETSTKTGRSIRSAVSAAWVTRAYGAGLDPCVAALSEGRLTSIPPLEGYADVADVLAAWTPKDWDVPPHLWGPPPPPEFLDNKEPPA